MTERLKQVGFRKARLRELVFFQRGFDITKAQQEPGPYPVISSSGIQSYHDEFMARGPGVVIGRKGTLGTIHFSDGDYWPHDTTLWSKELSGNNPRFVYYFLHTLNLENFNVGGANATLNRNHIHELEIEIPSAQIQSRIADILFAYDDLIENNLRRIALLEESARLLYKEWFVRLRFPGSEHTRIVDGVPEGWTKKELRELCDNVRDSVQPDQVEAETPYIGLEHMPRRSIALNDWGSAGDVQSAKHRFIRRDILFGKIRPYFHKVGVALTDGVASSDAIVLRPRSELLHVLVLMAVSSDVFVRTRYSPHMERRCRARIGMSLNAMGSSFLRLPCWNSSRKLLATLSSSFEFCASE